MGKQIVNLPEIEASDLDDADLFVIVNLGRPENITGFTISGCNDQIDGVWSLDGIVGGKPLFRLTSDGSIFWNTYGSYWRIRWDGDTFYFSSEDTDYPWEVTTWTVADGSGSPTFSSFVGGSPFTKTKKITKANLLASSV